MRRISADDVRELLDYDEKTGKLFWRERDFSWFSDDGVAKRWNSKNAGKEALGSLNSKGYLNGAILSVSYKAHRIVWLHQTGQWPDEIDHVNGIKTDNRMENLRDVDRAGNLKNMPRQSNNTSGATGVKWSEYMGKWRAVINVNRARVHLGYFSDFSDAVGARKAAEREIGFHPNHGRCLAGRGHRVLSDIGRG
ncbi:HNH endonuclease [uncultured Sphingomonas sp.]|uniref:HNH endonuclease n=1 Tax=uncultured Sphingomonas sp. TaxID=158754 RepID=UPI0025D771A8|nr:HNH endonuclease [uncultured Sphingomonas sp.]